MGYFTPGASNRRCGSSATQCDDDDYDDDDDDAVLVSLIAGSICRSDLE